MWDCLSVLVCLSFIVLVSFMSETSLVKRSHPPPDNKLAYSNTSFSQKPCFNLLLDPKCLHSAAIKQHVAKIKIINRNCQLFICLVAITVYLFNKRNKKLFITFYNLS